MRIQQLQQSGTSCSKCITNYLIVRTEQLGQYPLGGTVLISPSRRRYAETIQIQRLYELDLGAIGRYAHMYDRTTHLWQIEVPSRSMVVTRLETIRSADPAGNWRYLMGLFYAAYGYPYNGAQQ